MSFGLPYGLKEKNSEGKLRSINTINGERYVYYERLITDAQGPDDWRTKVYNKANSVLDWRVEHGSNQEDIGAFFNNLANYEFNKEKALLETHFQTRYDPTSKDCGKALIEAYNKILSTQEVFRRNALVIANTDQKGLFSYFPTYLDMALKDWLDNHDLSKEIQTMLVQKMVEDDSRSEKVSNAIQKYINDHALEITTKALQIMFSSDTKAESGLKKKVGDKQFEELGKAYKEVFKALTELNKSASTNEFIKGTIKTYKLDELGKTITDSLSGKKLTVENAESAVRGFSFKVTKKQENVPASGIFTELFGKLLGEISVGTKGPSFQGFSTGNIGEQKADFMYLVGASDSAVEAVNRRLSEFQNKGRGANVEDVQKLIEEAFAGFGDEKGFLIFVNAKNWSLGKKFKKGYGKDSFGGYSAGTPIDLTTWDDIMHKMNVRGRDFIFTILQMIPHAIGNPDGTGDKLEQVSIMFERAIGSALFDDFDAVDPFKTQKGARIVHLLYLNGIYIPLSVYYSLLSQAFYKAEEARRRDELVEVRFKMPNDIKYPNQEDEEADIAAGKKPWVEQSNEALKTIKVSYHFFKGFQDFMKEFYELNP